MIQVYFKKSPTGAPFYLAYSQGDHGFVTEQKAKLLAKHGIIDPIDFSESQAVPSADFVPSDQLDPEPVEKTPDMGTVAGVKQTYGNDISAMREYCKENGIKVSKNVKRPETFWTKIAKANK